MKIHVDKKYIHWGVTAFLVIGASIILYYIIFHASSFNTRIQSAVSIAMPIIDGIILAYLLTPLVNGIENKILKPFFKKRNISLNSKNEKRMRALSIVLTLIIVIFLVYAFFAMVIPQLLKSIQSIIFQFPVYVNNLEAFITKLLANNPDIDEFATEMLDKYSAQISDWLNSSVIPQMNELIKSLSLSVISFLKSIWNLIIGFIISIYILGSKETFCGQAKKMVYAFWNRKTANSIINDFRFTHKTFSGFISGKILDSLIIGLICFPCITLMDMPYAVLISVIIGVTNVIPFFGPYLGAIPSAFLILLINPVKCLYFIIFILILQQFDGNFLGPKILGESTGLSSFWVIFSITIFGGLFGIFGMIIGVPIFAVFYAFVKKHTNSSLQKKGLPIRTEKYTQVEIITSDNTFRELKDSAGEKKERSLKFSKKANLKTDPPKDESAAKTTDSSSETMGNAAAKDKTDRKEE